MARRKATAEQIRRETGVDVMARALDVTDAGAAASRRRGAGASACIDICVANAGGPPSRPLPKRL
jgi:NADP-dependent 3-hydroxy acid dehydrogenase YdfG